MSHLHAKPSGPWLQQRAVARPRPAGVGLKLSEGRLLPAVASIRLRLVPSPGWFTWLSNAKAPRWSLHLASQVDVDQVVTTSNASSQPPSDSSPTGPDSYTVSEKPPPALPQPSSHQTQQTPQWGSEQQQSHHKEGKPPPSSAVEHPTSLRHWDWKHVLGSKLTTINPLRLIFGKPWRKAVPLSMLFFACTSIFTMLQSLKDGIVVMAMGADALPYLTTLGTLPASLLFFNFYRLSLAPSVAPQHLFMATAAPLLAFYTVFAVVLYPIAPALHHPASLAWLTEAAPQGAAGLVAAVQQWLYSLFYVAADLWGPVMISLAFWTVADEVCSMSDAAQLYPQLGLLANLGLVGSGRFFKAVHAAVEGHMGAVLKVLVLCMLVMSAVMFVCTHHIYKRHISRTVMDPQHHHRQLKHLEHQQHTTHRVHHKQPAQASSTGLGSDSTESKQHHATLAADHSSQQGRLSGTRTSGLQAGLQDIRSVLVRNPAAAALAVTVVSFSVSYRMFEYSYKHLLRLATADSAAYCCKLADVQSAVGAATILLMLVSKFIFKYLGWSTAAFISPTAMLLAGTVFFACSLLNTSAAAGAAAGVNIMHHLPAGSAVTTAATWVAGSASSMTSAFRGQGHLPQFEQEQVMWLGLGAGYVTALAASACHNSLFTPCKQMVYKIMPEREVKDSKAVVDLVGGQFAKSAAGWLVQALLLTCGSITAAQPAMAVVYISAVFAWLCANVQLSKDMSQYSAHQNASPRESHAEQLVRHQQQQKQQGPKRHEVTGRMLAQTGQPQQQQQQQQQAAFDWPLPLPHDLAVAADSRRPEELFSGGTGGAEYVVIGSNSRHRNSGSSPVQHDDLVHSAVYWNAVYRQLADDPLLLEAVIQGRSSAAGQRSTCGAGGVQQEEGKQHKSSGTMQGNYTVMNGKEALHTYFDAY